MSLVIRVLRTDGKSVEETTETIRTTNGVMSIDGSTTNSGISIFDKGKIKYWVSARREKTKENPIEYKIALKNWVKNTIINGDIGIVLYEEPFCGYASAVENLYMLRSMVGEIVVEEKDKIGDTRVVEVSNKKWKKMFLSGEKQKTHTEEVKTQIKERAIRNLGFNPEITQDEYDSFGLGVAVMDYMKRHNGATYGVVSKGKQEFRLGSKLIVSKTEFWGDFKGIKGIPTLVKKQEVITWEMKRNDDWKELAYERLSNNKEKTLILVAPENSFADIILKEGLGKEVKDGGRIYMVVWAK